MCVDEKWIWSLSATQPCFLQSGQPTSAFHCPQVKQKGLASFQREVEFSVVETNMILFIILIVVTSYGWAMISTVTFEACRRPQKQEKQAVSIAATAKNSCFILKLCQSRFRKLTRQNDYCKQTGRCDKIAGLVKLLFFSRKLLILSSSPVKLKDNQSV